MHWYEQEDCEEFGDQNADTTLVPHGYWSLCRTDDHAEWRLTLLEQSDDLSEIIAEPYTGTFPSETDAKCFAAEREALGIL
ncbi:hypothetical protein K7Z75_24730 [Mycobacterium avium subsp. hominissuis]|uniref:hypothetical protein n=1 Tax=Mycobacterium avium TaxID=1764 RepID=UPI00293AA5F9|nr:hypothetical protein [Mycobacterium avium]MDV3306833.1 hypothetical protein [Mycobacterium avium subsp. hominissuis]